MKHEFQLLSLHLHTHTARWQPVWQITASSDGSKPRLLFAAPPKGFHGVGPNLSAARQRGSDWRRRVGPQECVCLCVVVALRVLVSVIIIAAFPKMFVLVVKQQRDVEF